MEVVAKKTNKSKAADNTKSSGGSFFKAAPGYVPQMVGNNGKTFFKPAYSSLQNNNTDSGNVPKDIHTNNGKDVAKSNHISKKYKSSVAKDNKVINAAPNEHINASSKYQSAPVQEPNGVVKENKSGAQSNKPKHIEKTFNNKPSDEAHTVKSGSKIKPIAVSASAKNVPGVSKKAAPSDTQTVNKSDTTSYLSSLHGQPPTAFIAAMKNADSDVNQIHSQEKSLLQKDMPVIDQPTGLPTLDKAGGIKAIELDATNASGLKAKSGGRNTKVDLPVNFTIGAPLVKNNNLLTQKKVDNSGFLKKELAKSIDSLPQTDESIETSLGPRPPVDLSGEADTAQVDQNNAESDADVMQQQANAQLLTQQDFGENNIYPEIKPERLSPKNKISPIAVSKGAAIMPAKVTDDIAVAFDKGATAHMQQQIDAQMIKNDEAVNKMQGGKEAENKNYMQQIDEQTAAAKNEQKEAQLKAKAEVKEQRTGWQNENEKIKQDYVINSKAKREEVDGQIDQKVSQANQDIDAKYAESEGQIAEEKANTEAEAAAKKKEAEEKQDSGGFFSAIGDFLSDVWDGIKAAVNFVFDQLRKLVKGIIELAKKAVNAIIDLVRDVVVGLIKAFGEVLKGFVNIALAAFPELAKKINAKIDSAVNYAVDKVNKLADDLKKAVNKLLDLLGSALDFILSVFQKAFNLLIDALKFLTAGLIKVIQGIANLVSAALDSPDYVVGALSEEALGADVTEALPNVERNDNEIAEFAKKYGSGASSGQTTGSEVSNANALQSKDHLSDDDVTTESPYPVVLEPELIAQAHSMTWQGDTLELGGAGSNPVTTNDLRNDVFGGNETTTAAPANDTPVAAESKAQGGMDWLHMSDDQKLDYHIDQMSKEPAKEIDAKEEKAKPKSDPEVPIEVKTGKLGVGKRLAFVGRQMIASMKMFWKQHKVAIIAGLAGALLLSGVVAFFTGGAGLLAIIEILMEVMALYFAASAIDKASDALMDYLKQAWDGYIVKGAKNLAKGFAIIVVNFLLDYVLEGVGAVIKRIKNFLKGTKTFGKISKAVATGIEKAKGLLSKAGETKIGGAFVKAGKYVLGGIEKGLGKGAKKLEELRAKILSKFGFKRLWLERRGHWLELWGEFNSKVLLAKIDEEGNTTFHIEDRPNAGKVGTKLPDGGIVIDDIGNKFSRNAEVIAQKSDQAALKKVYEDLDKLSDAERLKKIQSGNPHTSTRGDWDFHEKAVSANLSNTHPNQEIVEQLTLDIYDQNGNLKTTIRADNGAADASLNITLIDAKHQANAELARGIKKPMEVVTDNQSIGYQMIERGDYGKVVARGDAAEKLGLAGKEVKINPRVEIHTNDINGNIVRLDLNGKPIF